MADARTEKQKVKEITDRLEEGLKELFEGPAGCRSLFMGQLLLPR